MSSAIVATDGVISEITVRVVRVLTKELVVQAVVQVVVVAVVLVVVEDAMCSGMFLFLITCSSD